MKYVKHMTLKEWNRFNKVQKNSDGIFTPPGNDYNFRNHVTGKMESLQSITGQEILLSKYKIILTGYEPKYTRIYHKITSVINMKNFDKGMKVFDNSMKAFSKGVGESGKIDRQNRKNLEVINGKSKKSLGLLVWNDIKKDILGSPKKKRRRAPGVDEQFWGTRKKSKGRSVDDLIWGTRKKSKGRSKSGKRSKSVKEAVWGSNSKVKLM